MTYTRVKEKLHSYIENADQKKVKAIYALLESEIEDDEERFVYDEATLRMLEQRSEDTFSGKVKSYTLEESLEDIKKHRRKNGL